MVRASFLIGRDSVKKKICSLIASIVLILVAVIGLQNEKVVEAADKMVLLEKRHPGYWNYLSPDKMIEVQTIPGFEEVSTEEIKAGNVLKDFYQGNYGGVDITYKDGEMHFEGTATEDIWPSITTNMFNVASGTYFIAIGQSFPQDDVSIYFEKFRNGEQTILDWLNAEHFFYTDSSIEDEYKFTVGIKKGTAVDFNITPVLYKLNETNRLSELTKIALWKETPQLNETDAEIFNRTLLQFSAYQGCCIIDASGAGRFWSNSKEEWMIASMDRFGHISIN